MPHSHGSKWKCSRCYVVFTFSHSLAWHVWCLIHFNKKYISSALSVITAYVTFIFKTFLHIFIIENNFPLPHTHWGSCVLQPRSRQWRQRAWWGTACPSPRRPRAVHGHVQCGWCGAHGSDVPEHHQTVRGSSPTYSHCIPHEFPAEWKTVVS